MIQSLGARVRITVVSKRVSHVSECEGYIAAAGGKISGEKSEAEKEVMRLKLNRIILI